MLAYWSSNLTEASLALYEENVNSNACVYNMHRLGLLMHACLYKCIIYMRTCAHTHHTHRHTCMHTRTRTHRHTHERTHTHRHACTHTQTHKLTAEYDSVDLPVVPVLL